MWGHSQGRSLDLNCGQLEALGQIWVFERNPEATVKERTQRGGRKRYRETKLVGGKVLLQRCGQDHVERGRGAGGGLQAPWFLSW